MGVSQQLSVLFVPPTSDMLNDVTSCLDGRDHRAENSLRTDFSLHIVLISNINVSKFFAETAKLDFGL